MLTLFERGLVAHLIADWLLQNDWMAAHKGSLHHPAAWVHGSIYAVCLGLALGSWQAGLALGLLHMLVDTRQPLNWWRKIYRQTSAGPAELHVAIWSDQTVHIATLAVWIAAAP
jgi:hypothetical protein